MNLYNLTKEEVISKFNSNVNGITNVEANIRLEKNGLNKLVESKKRSMFLKFLDQFKNVMIIILIIAAILSGIVSILEKEPFTDTIIILVVVFLNAILGLLQESKAEKAIEALKKMSLPYIKVKRDNQVISIKTEELVIGDIVLVEAGDTIPADMRIIESHSLKVEEAALTGESVPENKIVDAIEGNIPLGDRTNMLYSGSSIVYGRGEAIVISTGMNTELGKIASSITLLESDETPLQIKMRELSKVLSILVIVIAAIMFVIGLIQGKEIINVFMLAIALAVAAIPEGLAAVITITLAIGVQKMANKKAIVRKLSAVEALGSTSIICSDKTGTLTQNKMTVRKIFKDNKVSDLESDDILSKIAVLCNDTKVSIENGITKLLGDPTETALIDFYNNFGLKKEVFDKIYERVDELPFDSVRKLMTSVNKVDGKYMTCTKGAIESILDKCDSILIDGKVYKLTDSHIKNITDNNKIFSNEALRVLGFAYRIDDELKVDENNLIFVGFIGMIDPPRKEVYDAVAECYSAGMIPIMITGDNIDTATAIAKELNILKDGDLAITGAELDMLSDDELKNKINKIKVYARVSPENKIRIVKMFKAIGKIVAMTGDGVNDAPALKGADIGIGMGITGTEVSKSVSSIVLSDDNFATIVVAVKEGRRIYTNIQNVIVYLLASNLAEVLIIFISMLFGKELLVPIQILWINLVTDTIPAIALGFEKEEKDIMNKKPRDAKEKFFTKFLTLRIVIPAVIKAIVVFGIYIFISNMYTPIIAAGAAFVTLASIEILFSFVCRSSDKSVLQIGLFTNIPMIFCVAFTLIAQIIILAIPNLRELLQVPYIPMNVYYIIICTVISTVLIFECIKIILAKKFSN